MVQSNTPGAVGVYLRAAIFQTIIKLGRGVNDNFPSTVCIKMLTFKSIMKYVLYVLSPQVRCHMESSLVTFIF